MPIKFRCPHCEQFLGISESKADSIADCPTCGRSIRVPALDGSVSAIPPPRLNLHDEELMAALGALAVLHHNTEAVPAGRPPLQPEIVQSHPSPPIFPIPAVQPDIPPQPEPSLGEEAFRTRESPAIPVAHVEDAEEPPASTEEVLAELIQEAELKAPPPVTRKPDPPVAPFSNRALMGMIVAALACGLLIGFALRSGGRSRPGVDQAPPIPPRVPEAPAPGAGGPQLPGGQMADVQIGYSIRGEVTSPGPAGEQRPDRGARILLLPLLRNGSVKLSGPALRVGADEVDRNVLAAAATALGGAFTQADSEGHFEVSVAREGRYGLLIASQYQSRPSNAPLTDNCREFLNRYLDRPDLALGDVDYYYAEVNLDGPAPVVRDVHFQSH